MDTPPVGAGGSSMSTAPSFGSCARATAGNRRVKRSGAGMAGRLRAENIEDPWNRYMR
jgi:hypothetical protein